MPSYQAGHKPNQIILFAICACSLSFTLDTPYMTAVDTDTSVLWDQFGLILRLLLLVTAVNYCGHSTPVKKLYSQIEQ